MNEHLVQTRGPKSRAPEVEKGAVHMCSQSSVDLLLFSIHVLSARNSRRFAGHGYCLPNQVPGARGVGEVSAGKGDKTPEIVVLLG